MPVETQARKDFPVPYGLVFVFAILAASILLAGYFSFREYEKKDRAGVEHQLSAIADLKVDELVHWRIERLADAEMIYGNASFAKLARRYFADPQDREAGQQIGDLLEEYSEHYEYNQVRLLDPQGVTLMSLPPQLPPASAAVLPQISEVLQSGRATIGALYRHDHDHLIYLSVLIPILDASTTSSILGVVALRVDPAKFLFPHILRWPSPSETAETLLVRREGDEVVYLNVAKFQKKSALNQRLSLTSTENPAVLAVLGRTGIVEGVGCQGQPVIADVRAVPDSPWFLVTMINTSEVYAPARGQLWIIAGFMAALLFGTGTGLAFVWHQQKITFYRTRYQAAEALRKSEEKFRVLFESAKDGILQLAANGDVVALNESFASMHGYTVKEMLEMNLKDLDTPESARLAPARLQRLFAGEAMSFEVEHYCKNGQTIPLEVSANLVIIGAAQYILGFHRDISARRQAEEEIRRNEQFIRSILDTVDEGFLVIDPSYRIMTANKAYCDSLALNSDEVLGRHCFEVSHRSSRPCYQEGEECAVREVFATGKPHASLHKHPGPNGRVIYVETKAFPVKDASGAVTSAIETINNITEKHLLEEERLKTQKLESIGTLAGGIAHDFNNLLQGVFGYISMAKMTHDKKEKSLAMLEQAEKALHMTVNLTTQLLTFSKGGKPLKKVIGLSLPLENAVKFALSGSQTDYRLDIAPGLWPVEADEGQLAQVIQNIVLNANQAMAGRDTVNVTAANVDIPAGANPRLPQGGRFIRLEIRDSGTGISQQNMLKIFDPYFTTKQKGSGLGLATSYSIIKNHGGVIEVHSELHKGTTFTIYLPTAQAGGREAEHPVVEAIAATQGRRILLMDDEALVRSVATEMIEALGHELVCAEDGDTAIALFLKARESGEPFDLLILDLTVKGGMGGEEALRKIREIDPGVKAIVSSGYADNQVVAHFRDYGFAAFLNKPYKLAALQECLSGLLV